MMFLALKSKKLDHYVLHYLPWMLDYQENETSFFGIDPFFICDFMWSSLCCYPCWHDRVYNFANQGLKSQPFSALKAKQLNLPKLFYSTFFTASTWLCSEMNEKESFVRCEKKISMLKSIVWKHSLLG